MITRSEYVYTGKMEYMSFNLDKVKNLQGDEIKKINDLNI